MTYAKVLELEAPAKINLGLKVLENRADGYHNLETIFLALDWYDRIIISPSKELGMTCSNADLPTDQRNLVIRAAGLLKETANVGAGAAIHLEKNIPFGAGLGGGSSDAATVLQGLNEFWGLGLNKVELMAIGLQVGSDVPFFIDPRPAYASGRGELFTYLTEPALNQISTPKIYVTVLESDVHVSTSEAFSRIPAPVHTISRRAIDSFPFSRDRWMQEMENDFEAPIFDWYPQLRENKDQLLNAGAFFASMSGSGSAIYGCFDDKDHAEAVLRQCGGRGRVCHILHI